MLFRWYNVSEGCVEVMVPLGRRYREIGTCRRDETRERLLATDTDVVALAVVPKPMLTLELVP